MCTSCGNSSCGGNCKKACIKVYKPTRFIGAQTGIPGEAGDPGVGIVNIVDNGDGTFTIFLSDASSYVIDIPSDPTPNDPWVVILNNGAGISGVTWQGSATNNALDVNVAYKVIAPDAAIVKVRTFVDVTFDDAGGPGNESINRALNYRFTLDPIPIGGSNWFPTESKSFTTIFTESFAVPIQITPVWDGVTPGIANPLLSEYQSKGRGFSNNGLFFVQSAGPVVAPGRYQFLIEWEIACQLNLVP
jgi:hypothetical protein